MITIALYGLIAGMFKAWYEWALVTDLEPGDMPKAVTIGGIAGAVIACTAYMVIKLAVQS